MKPDTLCQNLWKVGFLSNFQMQVRSLAKTMYLNSKSETLGWLSVHWQWCKPYTRLNRSLLAASSTNIYFWYFSRSDLMETHHGVIKVDTDWHVGFDELQPNERHHWFVSGDVKVFAVELQEFVHQLLIGCASFKCIDKDCMNDCMNDEIIWWSFFRLIKMAFTMLIAS